MTPNPDSAYHKQGLPPSLSSIVRDVTTAASVDLKAFSGQWVWLKCEGAAGERIGFHTWRVNAAGAPLGTAADGQIGANVDPDLTARTGSGQCPAIDTGERLRLFVVPGFTVLRVIASTGTLVLRVTKAQL